MSPVIDPRPVPLERNKHGTLIVSGTRILLDTIVYAFRNGDSAEEIVESFDVLRLADVYAIFSNYLDHRDEVDAYLRRQEAETEKIREQMATHFPPEGLRQRLLARRK